MAKTVEKGRSAKTGQFVSIDYAKTHPSKLDQQSIESNS